MFEIGDFSQISLERLTADVEPSDVETALDRLAEERRAYSEKPAGATAEIHDRITIDFDGTIDGVPFEGGEGRDIQVALGSNTFLPGFEDQLIGVAVGDKRTVRATFPEAYAVRALAGKTADFDVTVKAVAARDPFALDDEFAKSMGSESLDKLKETIRDRIAAEYARVSRDKLKRQLLDKLDKLYSFELPEGLVNQEFNSIWEQVTREQQASGRTFADENTTEEAARADYRKIAERRVRLGLLLGRSRDEGGGKGFGRGDDPGPGRPGAVVSGPGKASLGFLPQQQPSVGRATGSDLRGEGGRPYLGPRQGRRAESNARKSSSSRSMMSFRASRQD